MVLQHISPSKSWPVLSEFDPVDMMCSATRLPTNASGSLPATAVPEWAYLDVKQFGDVFDVSVAQQLAASNTTCTSANETSSECTALTSPPIAQPSTEQTGQDSDEGTGPSSGLPVIEPILIGVVVGGYMSVFVAIAVYGRWCKFFSPTQGADRQKS